MGGPTSRTLRQRKETQTERENNRIETSGNRKLDRASRTSEAWTRVTCVSLSSLPERRQRTGLKRLLEKMQVAIVGHAFNPSTQDAEPGGTL